MKKIIYSLVILGLLLVLPMQTFAQDTQPVIENNTVTVSFADLGITEQDMFSPYGSSRILFATPPNWKLPSTATLTLDLDVFFSGADAALVTENESGYGGSLDVSFNNQTIASINLTAEGPQTYTVEIPARALVPSRNDQRHELLLFLDASISCEYDIQTVVSVHPTSSIEIPFEESPINADLTRLPWPFFVRDPLLPAPLTLIVVPDAPSVTELQAMLNVAAGFGSITNNDFNYKVVSAGRLQEEQWGDSHLVFVGLPEAFSAFLTHIQLPVPVVNGQFADLSGAYADDGVVQIAQSPWNPNRAVLVISGNSETAVDKAAKAFSTGSLFVNQDPRKTLVSNVSSELLYAQTLVEDFYLGDLGYAPDSLETGGAQSVGGLGGGGLTYVFNVAKEQVNSQEAYIDLVYNHSGILDYGASSVSLRLNGSLIATIQLSDETTALTTLHVDIPPGLFHFGENELTVDATLLPYDSCDVLGTTDYWFTVYPESLIHIPVASMTENLRPSAADLKMFPENFVEDINLSDLAFVLPENSPESWHVASQIAFILGNIQSPTIADIAAAYGSDVPASIVNDRTMVVVGLASTLPMISDLNSHLPAPFDVATDTAAEYGVNVVYSIPPGESVGYLEMIRSPYNAQRTIMVVSGNNDVGVQLASNALILPNLRGQISGVFTVTNGTQVAVSRSYGTGVAPQESVVGEVLPDDAESVVNQPMTLPENSQSTYKPPVWIFLVILISIAAVALILLYIFKSSLFRKSKEVEAVDEEDIEE